MSFHSGSATPRRTDSRKPNSVPACCTVAAMFLFHSHPTGFLKKVLEQFV
jgi:hypothetical protein